MTQKLPLFNGYFVDVRLKQFRKVNNQRIIFIEFSSEGGEIILNKYIKSLNPRSRKFKELIHNF